MLSESCDWSSLAKQASDPALELSLLAFEQKLTEAGINPAALRSVAAVTSDKQSIGDRYPSAGAPSSAVNRMAAAHLAKQQLSRYLTITDINNFPAPRRPDAVTFVVAQHDQYIPAQGAIADKWKLLEARWPGAQVQWIRGGHVSAILFPKVSPTRIITDVVKKLMRH